MRFPFQAFGRAAQGAPRDVPADSVAPRVRGELGRSRSRVAARVESLNATTEREILACGRVLSRIVETARELIAENDAAVAAAAARSDESATRFIAEMQGDIDAQEAAVSSVLSLADGMEEAVVAIGSLSQYSDILSINARIEAARIGEQGGGFAIIADHTRELSNTIRKAAERVSVAIAQVRAGLPPVRERASSMQERARAFGDLVNEQVSSASMRSAAGSGGRQIEAVMRLSNEALSHLQFQDSLAQELGSINRDLEVLAERVSLALDGREAPAEPVHEDSHTAGERLAPGKAVMFQQEEI